MATFFCVVHEEMQQKCYRQSRCSFSFFICKDLTFQFLDLLEAMKSCLEIIKAFPFLLDVVYNIKEWLSPHAEELHAHTQPKSFKFVRDEQGHCIMYYRNNSHMKWEGPQQLLKVHACYTVIKINVNF